MSAELVAFLFRLLSRLSLRQAQRIGRALGAIGWHFKSRPVTITKKNIAACFPELSAAEQFALGKRSLQETAATAMELPLMWEWPVERCLGLIKDIEGEQLLQQANTSGRGLLVLAPHLGNWELTGLFIASRYKMAALYSPPNQASLDSYMKRVRERSGSELVPADRRGVMRLFKVLREGGVVGILPDQAPRREGGDLAPFFGIPTITMTLAAKLARKTGALVLVTYARRLPDGAGFRIIIREVDPAIASDDGVIALTALNRAVEAVVREVPEQYQWEYKRFRRPVPEYPDLYA